MLKMLIIVFILLEIFSFAKSGEDISHDGYTDKLDNLQSESINAQDSLSSLQFQPSILDFLQRYFLIFFTSRDICGKNM